MDTEKRIEALAKHFDIEPNYICETAWGTFAINGEEYDVFTDQEADTQASINIQQSLWAFNHSFLVAHSKAMAAIPERHWIAMVERECENLNTTVVALLGQNLHSMIEDAIRCDGRGHYLSNYDGDEIELGHDLYAYRVN